MRMKLNTKIIKDSLIEELIRDKRIISLLDYQDDHLKVHEIMNKKIFTYLKPYSSYTSAKSFISVDVDEYENDYKVRIKIECHEDLSNSEESKFYNKADVIAVYVRECIYKLFPKATGYHNVPHYGSSYLIREISFRLENEDECVIKNKSSKHKEELTIEEILQALLQHMDYSKDYLSCFEVLINRIKEERTE